MIAIVFLFGLTIFLWGLLSRGTLQTSAFAVGLGLVLILLLLGLGL